MLNNSIITACGSYLPPKILTNDDLTKLVDTSDEWITSRTGIKQRHIAGPDVLTSHLAYLAAMHAINSSNFDREKIDLIIVATTTPDNTFPSTACKVQALLGIKNCAAFDIQAVCAGFIFAMSVADSFIKSGQATHALVIGADCMSKLLNWQDRSTCVLFGDGAGAVIVSKQESVSSSIIASKIHSDGTFQDLLYTNGGVGLSGQAGSVQMQGPALTKHAVEKMSKSMIEILAENNLSLEDVTFCIPHQANLRILDAVAHRVKLPPEKLIVTLDRHANTSAASIPLALSSLHSDNRLKRGDIILMVAIGGGLCWGACLVRW